jgi:hypothetical protein
MSVEREQLNWFSFSLHPARRAALWFAVIAVGIGMFPAIVHTTGSSTCLHCRAEVKTTTTLGYGTVSTNENEFTVWYHEHRPTHEHQWIDRGIFGYNIYGLPIKGRGCGFRHPITDLPWMRELDHLRTASPESVDAFFSGILSTNRSAQRTAVHSITEPMRERTQTEYRRSQAK